MILVSAGKSPASDEGVGSCVIGKKGQRLSPLEVVVPEIFELTGMMSCLKIITWLLSIMHGFWLLREDLARNRVKTAPVRMYLLFRLTSPAYARPRV